MSASACRRGLVVCLLATSLACSFDPPAEVVDAATGIPERVEYNRDVRPILSDRCFKCHGPDAAARATDLRLDSEEGARTALTASRRRRAIDPGDPGSSELVHRILSGDPAYRMPPPDSKLTLTAPEKAVLLRWIEQDARYEPHWAFQSPREAEPPEVTDEAWVRDALDRFVLARLEAAGMRPSPEADREILLRRVSLDLTGLPPTIEEVDAFLADPAPGAYERAVDRLLAGEAYGEHMAASWLDLARYADSHGYQDDGMRTMWPWRDWVVSSFNRNQPYDEFVTWQLAGDLLPGATDEQILATGFNRNHLQSQEGGIVDEEYRVEYVADRTNTFGRAFLGLTVECGRCHAHKYDPISQEEYYGLFAFFNSVNEVGSAPYAGEASPVLVLTDEETRAGLADVGRRIDAAEAELASLPEEPFRAWLSASRVRAESIGTASEPPVLRARLDATPSGRRLTLPGAVDGLAGHYPMEGFVEADERLNLDDLVRPDRPGYFWGDRDKLPEEVDGVSGRGLRLRGDGWLDMGADRFYFERNEPFSLGLWVRTATDSTHGPVFGKSGGLFNGKRGYLCLLQPDGTLSASLNHAHPDNTIEVRSLGRLPSGSWHHVAMTYDGSSRAAGIRLYLDGRPMETATVTDHLRQSIRFMIDPATGDTVNWGGSGNLAIGYEGGNLPTTSSMDVDEFRVFGRRLSHLEVAGEAGARDTVATLAGRPPDALSTDQTEALSDHFAAAVSREAARVRETLRLLRARENDLLTARPSVMVMRDLPEPRATHVLVRGAYDAPGARVDPTTPAAVLPFGEDLPPNRLGLARWLFDERHPLTARVAVNRFWQGLFGEGLVPTADNFGFQGAVPTHPELLDHLAVRFRKSGWNTKALLRAIVTSATYRQSSVADPEAVERDPANRLLARGPSGRLPAETVRDAALAASGLLVRRLGGPPTRPYQPPGLWKELATRNATEYVQDHGDKLYRRSLYTIWKRTTPPPSMMSFDAAERNVCVVRRQRTNTPLQALVLMNDPQFVEAARMLGERAVREEPSGAEARVGRIFRLLTGRRPASGEIAVLAALRADAAAAFARDPARAGQLLAVGEHPRDRRLDRAEVAALAVVASTVMNMDAFVTRR